jgi:hypothetical protein
VAKLGLSLKGVEINNGSSSDYSIVPDGTYTVVVGKTETKDTKSGTALILGYKVLDGEFEGKLVKDFLNIENPSQDAVRISMERLATVAFATGFEKGEIEDSDELINLEPFSIIVTKEDDGEYKRNRVKAVLTTREVKPVKQEVKKAAAPWRK